MQSFLSNFSIFVEALDLTPPSQPDPWDSQPEAPEAYIMDDETGSPPPPAPEGEPADAENMDLGDDVIREPIHDSRDPDVAAILNAHVRDIIEQVTA